MKLSKAQQALVDKMKEGNLLYLSYGWGWGAFIGGPNNDELHKVHFNTARSLLKKGLLLVKDEKLSSLSQYVYTLNEEAL